MSAESHLASEETFDWSIPETGKYKKPVHSAKSILQDFFGAKI